MYDNSGKYNESFFSQYFYPSNFSLHSSYRFNVPLSSMIQPSRKANMTLSRHHAHDFATNKVN